MLYATNLNSASTTERMSAERYDWLVYASKKERRRDAADALKCRKADAAAAAKERARDQEIEAERKLWHRVKS